MSNVEAENRKDTLVQHQRGGTGLKRLISLLAGVIAVVMFSLPGFAQTSYTWQINCRDGAATGYAGAGASWFWLNNGNAITSGTQPDGITSCLSLSSSGSGVVPTSINGIQVNGIQVILSINEGPAGCGGFASVAKSFDPSNPKFNISAGASAPSQNGWKPLPATCPKASFHFTLSAP